MFNSFLNFAFRNTLNFCTHRNKFLNFSFVKNLHVRSVMRLSEVISVFEKHVPQHLAEKWDNTGLLIEPIEHHSISTIFFTNDLCEDVLDEALDVKADLIISYHPPLFKPMKAFLCKNWKDRIAMKCITNNVAVYSPHTACDAVSGGVNDWLISCFDLEDKKPVISGADHLYCVLECLVTSEENLVQAVGSHLSYRIILRNNYDLNKLYLKVLFSKDSKEKVISWLSKYPEIEVLTANDCAYPKLTTLTGMGRIGKLQKPLKMVDCIEKVKKHVGLEHLRVTFGMNKFLDSEISTIAVCAGSGSSVLNNAPADLYITGEMSHHDLLDVRHQGKCAILCEHSNSERGYLAHLAKQLTSDLPSVNLIVSSIDKDPVCIM